MICSLSGFSFELVSDMRTSKEQSLPDRGFVDAIVAVAIAVPTRLIHAPESMRAGPTVRLTYAKMCHRHHAFSSD
jgi:hypothetical protein